MILSYSRQPRSVINRSSSRGVGSALVPDVLRLSEACCIISCVCITVSSIRERGGQKQADMAKQGKKTKGITQPQSNLLPSYDDTYSNNSYVTLLLTLALAVRGVADLLSRFKTSSPSLSLDGAARLARLEAMVSEQSRALESGQRAAEKSRLRYDLYSSGESL